MADNAHNDPDHISLNVLSQDKKTIVFTIRKTVPLKKLMTVYCKMTDTEMGTIKFMYNESPILAADTALSLDMKESDVLRVMKMED